MANTIGRQVMTLTRRRSGCGWKNCDLKAETESLIFAAQEQALRTN